MGKKSRQGTILNLIQQNNIETQDELKSLLEERGYHTTQATISRDIRELNITKVTYNGNCHKYAVRTTSTNHSTGSYKQILENSMMSIDYSENIIVVKTVPGMAMAVAAAIDNLDMEGIMGCIAGDDTIFLAIKRSSMAQEIVGEIKNVAKHAY